MLVTVSVLVEADGSQLILVYSRNDWVEATGKRRRESRTSVE